MGRLQVGETLNSHFAEVVPVGTVMRSGSRDYELAGDRFWERLENRAYRYGLGDFTWNSCRIVSFPNGMTMIETPQETVLQYKWRFREHALTAAVTNGVSYSASEEALADMGAGPDAFPLGAGLQFRNPESFNRLLPAGSIVYSGNPENGDGYSVWSKHNDGRWYRMLGTTTNSRAPGDNRGGRHVVYSVGGNRSVPEWVKAEGTEADVELIAEFQQIAWQRGWQLKQSQSWCSTYENVMSAFGLTRESTRRISGYTVGARVSPEAASNLPPGTLLGWQSTNNPAERVLFVRTNNANNVARTVRVGGTAGSSTRNYHSSMILIASPEAQATATWNVVCELPVSSPWRDLIPAGSLFTNTVGGMFDYRIVEGEGANQTRDTDLNYRRWGLNDFGEGGVLYFNTLEGVQL